jgi:hypothetical protein
MLGQSRTRVYNGWMDVVLPVVYEEVRLRWL